MKKLISLMLILCMACMLVPAMADDDVTGEWTMIKAVVQGMEMDPTALGMEMVIILNADGTAEAKSSYGEAEPEVSDGTWTMDGSTVTITIGGEPAEFIYEDGQLIMDMGEQGKMIFSKDAVAAPAAQAANIIAANSIEDFSGSWKLTTAKVMGMEVPISMLASVLGQEMDITMTVEGEQVTMSMSFGGEVNEGVVPAELRDGALVVSESGQELVFQLTDADSVVVIMTVGEQEVSMTLNKVDAAAEEPAA